jgi:hypothetical protein
MSFYSSVVDCQADHRMRQSPFVLVVNVLGAAQSTLRSTQGTLERSLRMGGDLLKAALP